MLLRLILVLLLSAACCSQPLKDTVLAVIASDKEATYEIAEVVRQIRESHHLRKDQLPIVRVPATKLSPQDFQRIGFNRQSLPVIALMKVSSSQNLECVLGNPPYIFRNVKQPRLAAQVLLCRWSEMTGRAIPEDLRSLGSLYEPFRVFILNTGETPEQVEATARAIDQVRAAVGVSDHDLPVLSTTYHEGLLGEDEYTRLGFNPDAFPIVCLVQMSESANPSKIVGEGILRWSYNSLWAARQILMLWARYSGKTLNGLEEELNRLSVLRAGWSDGTLTCLVTNYRYGVSGRIWLQWAGRIVNEQQQEVAQVAVTDFRREGVVEGRVETESLLQAPLAAPSQPGNYLIELEVRDKLGNAKSLIRVPLKR